jgi:hypothetical protein
VKALKVVLLASKWTSVEGKQRKASCIRMPPKTRVAAILREKVGSKSSANKSADLKTLTEKYQLFCKNVGRLAQALRQHLGSLQQIEKTRSLVSDWIHMLVLRSMREVKRVGVSRK